MTDLDPARRKAAEQRVNAALANAAYHERRAAQERTKAETLARVWGIDCVTDRTDAALDSDAAE